MNSPSSLMDGQAKKQSVSVTRLETFYGGLETVPLLRAVINDEFKNRIALISSFGADAAVLLALVAEAEPDTLVLFLETHKHFPETLDYARALTRQLGLTNVQWLEPEPKKLARIDTDGTLWQTQPNRCCFLRKVEPLNKALEKYGVEAIITGRKRFQTPERAAMEIFEKDEDDRYRINPLAHWTRERIASYIKAKNLPPHPLVKQGYRSIGCAPCTRPVKEGEDERAGRWSHMSGLDESQKTECGIHLPGTETQDWSI